MRTDERPTEDEMDRGTCCMTAHANAVAPWTCDCPCHKRAAPAPQEAEPPRTDTYIDTYTPILWRMLSADEQYAEYVKARRAASPADEGRFAEALLDPPEPNDALRKIADAFAAGYRAGFDDPNPEPSMEQARLAWTADTGPQEEPKEPGRPDVRAELEAVVQTIRDNVTREAEVYTSITEALQEGAWVATPLAEWLALADRLAALAARLGER